MHKDKDPYSLTFDNVWKRGDADIEAEIIALWKNNQLLPAGSDPVKRAKQVVYTIRNAENRIVGVTTAFPEYAKLLRNHVFMFRCFIEKDYRVPGLLTKITVMTRDFLNELSRTFQPPCIGMMSIVENTRINEHRLPVYKGGEMIFIGYTPNGRQMRIYYFDGALI